MTPEIIGVIGILVLLVLFLLKVPVGISLIFVGFFGFSMIRTFDAGFIQLGASPFATASSYSLIVIPLFIVMGMILSYCNIGNDLFRAVDSWIGHVRGGMAFTTLGTSAIFSSISGSVNATTASMSRITLPELKKYGYSPTLSAASVAAGGTLGVLIPPSVILILYGVLTMEPIGALLVAGLVPGLINLLLFMFVVYIWVRKDPQSGPPSEKSSWKTRFKMLSLVWPFMILFLLTIGGIYFGIFTPTEAGAIGATGALLLSIIMRRMNIKRLIQALGESTRLSAMIFLILIGADLFSQFLAVSRIPTEVTMFVNQLDWSPIMIMIMILIVLLVLGLFLEGIAILVLTLPVIYPIVMDLGFDGIWFGIMMVMVINIGLITPPLGISVYIISGVMKDIKIERIFKAVIPMVVAMLVAVILFILFPELITFVPNLMTGGG